jgi:hypothetical protein
MRRAARWQFAGVVDAALAGSVTAAAVVDAKIPAAEESESSEDRS